MRISLYWKGNSPNIIGDRWSSITGILVIVQLCGNVMFWNLCLMGGRFDDLAKCMADGLLNSSTSHVEYVYKITLSFRPSVYYGFKKIFYYSFKERSLELQILILRTPLRNISC